MNATTQSDDVRRSELLKLFADIPVAVICDAQDLLGLPSTYLNDVLPIIGSRLIGFAHTIERIAIPANASQAEIEPSLGLGVQTVIDSASSGDVIVLAAGGEHSNSVWGGNMGLRASHIGVAGVITDGALRDVQESEVLGLAFYGTGINARRSFARMVSVSIGRPVVLSGVRIRPGDLVIGDRDGVVIVQPEHAVELAAKARIWMEAESNMQAHIRAGNSMVDSIRKYKK